MLIPILKRRVYLYTHCSLMALPSFNFLKCLFLPLQNSWSQIFTTAHVDFIGTWLQISHWEVIMSHHPWFWVWPRDSPWSVGISEDMKWAHMKPLSCTSTIATRWTDKPGLGCCSQEGDGDPRRRVSAKAPEASPVYTKTSREPADSWMSPLTLKHTSSAKSSLEWGALSKPRAIWVIIINSFI